MLNETDLKNILAFLSRVNLTGTEAPTFTELCTKIQASIDQLNKPIQMSVEQRDIDQLNKPKK